MQCEFSSNSAASVGGAVKIREFCPADFEGCTFSENSAEAGGAVICEYGSSVTFTNCIFRANRADNGGGGAAVLGGQIASMERCTFSGNSSSACGGALFLAANEAAVTNCTFSQNGALEEGGATYFHGGSGCRLDHTIIAFSTQGEAIACAGTPPSLTCCDIYGNAGGDWVGCIESQYGVNGNISTDPLFCDPENDDFTLQECSPCAPFSPPNPECDLIGAWPIGCGGTPVSESTWGALKALFRR